MRLLKSSKAETVGILELLWHFTARFSPLGDIGKWSNPEIAAAVDFSGDPDALVRGLVESGWLDESDDYRLVVHDWHEHADNTTRQFLHRKKESFLSLARPSLPKPKPEVDVAAYFSVLESDWPLLPLEKALAVQRALFDYGKTLCPLDHFKRNLSAWKKSKRWRDGYVPSPVNYVKDGTCNAPPPEAKSQRSGAESPPSAAELAARGVPGV